MEILNDHGCLGCQRLESGPTVTLITGAVVCNYCPAWKNECLARHVLSLPGKTERRKFLAEWASRNGNESALRLGDLVRAVWDRDRCRRA